MPEEIRELYQKNGIAHLLAVSGLHLSLVSMALRTAAKSRGGYGRGGGGGRPGTHGLQHSHRGIAIDTPALIMTLCGFWQCIWAVRTTFIGHGSVGADTFVVQSLSGGSGRSTAVVCSHRRNRTERKNWKRGASQELNRKMRQKRPCFLGADGESAHAWEQPPAPDSSACSWFLSPLFCGISFLIRFTEFS